MSGVYFRVRSRLGKEIRTTGAYWSLIVSAKHPSMRGKEGFVKDALKDPDEIRQSKSDTAVFIYYKSHDGRHVAVVCRHLNGEGHI